MIRRRKLSLATLLRIAIFANLIHAGISSNPAGHSSSSGGKKRTRHHAQITVQHVEDGDEMYHEMAMPLSSSQRKQQRHDSITNNLRMLSHSVDGDARDFLTTEEDGGEILFLSSSETKGRNEQHLPPHDLPSRSLRFIENHKKQEKNYMERELNQNQYNVIGVSSSRESVGDGDRPKGMVVRRGRLFHNRNSNSNSKGGKRNGNANKWSKGSKWSKSWGWDDCYWKATPTSEPTNLGPEEMVPTLSPTLSPTMSPNTEEGTPDPTLSPTLSPSIEGAEPNLSPTLSPTISPSMSPANGISPTPSRSPTLAPSLSPSLSPGQAPSLSPTVNPTLSPSLSPAAATSSKDPTLSPTQSPSLSPTILSAATENDTNRTISNQSNVNIENNHDRKKSAGRADTVGVEINVKMNKIGDARGDDDDVFLWTEENDNNENKEQRPAERDGELPKEVHGTQRDKRLLTDEDERLLSEWKYWGEEYTNGGKKGGANGNTKSGKGSWMSKSSKRCRQPSWKGKSQDDNWQGGWQDDDWQDEWQGGGQDDDWQDEWQGGGQDDDWQDEWLGGGQDDEWQDDWQGGGQEDDWQDDGAHDDTWQGGSQENDLQDDGTHDDRWQSGG